MFITVVFVSTYLDLVLFVFAAKKGAFGHRVRFSCHGTFVCGYLV